MSKITGLLIVTFGLLAIPAIAVLALIGMTGSAIACTNLAGATLAATAPIPAPARLWIALTHSACPDLPEPWIAALMQQESDFHPAAHRSASKHGDADAGARGVFQLSASAWHTAYGASWNADLDGNGTPDIDDPETHATVAGHYLCAQLREVRRLRSARPQWTSTHELPELDAVLLTLAAGESGLRNYPDVSVSVSRFLSGVRERTSAWTAPSHATETTVDPVCLESLGTAGAVVLPAGTTANVAQAVRTALNAVGQRYGWHNRCDRLVCRAYGYANSGYPTATAHWEAMIATGHAHPGDRCPPVGAFVFWASSQPAGHVALVVQSSAECDPNMIKVVSNDVLDSRTGYDGGVYLVDLAQIEHGFVRSNGYRGWSDPMCVGSGSQLRLG